MLDKFVDIFFKYFPHIIVYITGWLMGSLLNDIVNVDSLILLFPLYCVLVFVVGRLWDSKE